MDHGDDDGDGAGLGDGDDVEAPGEEVPEAPFSGSHAAQDSGRVGPPLLGLVALLSSVFFPLPFSRRKTSCVIFLLLFGSL